LDWTWTINNEVEGQNSERGGVANSETALTDSMAKTHQSSKRQMSSSPIFPTYQKRSTPLSNNDSVLAKLLSTSSGHPIPPSKAVLKAGGRGHYAYTEEDKTYCLAVLKYIHDEHPNIFNVQVTKYLEARVSNVCVHTEEEC
jgi:hypothetical protein